MNIVQNTIFIDCFAIFLERSLKKWLDAFTQGLRHSATDIYIPLVGNELSLSVRRNWGSEVFFPSNSKFPSELPEKPFGVGWSANVCSYIKFHDHVQSDCNETRSDYAIVVDENGSSFRFKYIENTFSFVPFPNNLADIDANQATLTKVSESRYIFTKKHGTTLTFEMVPKLNYREPSRFSTYPGFPNVSYMYARLIEVKDRFESSLNYVYGANDTLIPENIRSYNETGPQITIYPDSDNRNLIKYIEDPQGNLYEYVYEKVNYRFIESVTLTLDYLHGLSLFETNLFQMISDAGGRNVSYMNGTLFATFQITNQYTSLEALKGSNTDFWGEILGTNENYSVCVYENEYHSLCPGNSFHDVDIRMVDFDNYFLTEVRKPSVEIEKTDGSLENRKPVVNYGYGDNKDSSPGMNKWATYDNETPKKGFGRYVHHDLKHITDANQNTYSFIYELDHYRRGVGALYEKINDKLEFKYKMGYTLKGNPQLLTKVTLPSGDKTKLSNESELAFSLRPAGSTDNVLIITFEDASDANNSEQVVLNIQVNDLEEFQITVNTNELEDIPSLIQQNLDTDLEPVVTNKKSVLVTDVLSVPRRYLFGNMHLRKNAETVEQYSLYFESLEIANYDSVSSMNFLGSEIFTFSPSQGMSLASAKGFSGNTTHFYYDDYLNVKSQVNPDTTTRNMLYGIHNQLNKLTDENGNITEYTFNENGLRDKEYIKKSSENIVQETEYKYENHMFPGFVTKKITKTLSLSSDPDWVVNRIVKYDPVLTGNGLGEIWKETVVMDEGSGSGLSTIYEYDQNHNKTSVTDPKQYPTTFEYDDLNRLKKIIYPGTGNPAKKFRYDARGNKVLEIDEKQIETRYYYDELNRLTDVVRDMNDNGANKSDSVDIKTSYTYNKVNSKKTEIDPRGKTTTYYYDNLQRLTKEEDPDGKFTRYFYEGPNAGGSAFDADGFNPTKIINRRGYETIFHYNKRGWATEEHVQYDQSRYAITQKEYDNVGNLRFITDPLGKRVEQQYDVLNRLVKTIYLSTAHSAETRYTSTGLPYYQRDEENNVTENEYDAAGRLTKIIYPEVYDAESEQNVHPETLRKYDDNGNLWKETNARGDTWTYVYNERNRKTDEILPPVKDYLTGNTLSPTITYTYDPSGNVLTTTDPLGNITHNKYDNASRLTDTYYPQISYKGNLVIPSKHYKLDRNGNIEQLKDENEHTTINTYNAFNRIKTSTDPEGNKVKNQYDEEGNLTHVWDGNDNLTQFVYDGLNRQTKTIYPDGKEIVSEYGPVDKTAIVTPNGDRIEYQYTDRHWLHTETHVGSTENRKEYGYDAVGNIKYASYGGNDLRNVSYLYDKLYRKIEETSAGTTHNYYYDLAGNLHKMEIGGSASKTITSEYDVLNRLETMTTAAGSSSYGYDHNGNIVYQSLPNGNIVNNCYDALNRLVTKEVKNSTATMYREWVEHDPLGNVTHLFENFDPDNQNTGASGQKVANRENSMEYDKANRLRTETETIRAIQNNTRNIITKHTEHRYDKANNRTDKFVTGSQGNYQINYNINTPLNQTTDIHSNGTHIAHFTYDDNGNRKTRVDKQSNQTTDTYQYDYQNRLVSVNHRGTTYQYQYDYRTRRIHKQEGAKSTRVVFSGGTSIMEYENNASSPTVTYYRGSDYGGGIGGILYSDRLGTGLRYNLYNHRGDVVGQNDQAGNINYLALYDAFGTHKIEYGESSDPQRANTKDEDKTGLLNEGFRYRDLEIGVFLTRDPLGFVDGPNLYTYVKQNPWSKFDPQGLFADELDIVHDTTQQITRRSAVQGGIAVSLVSPVDEIAIISSIGKIPGANKLAGKLGGKLVKNAVTKAKTIGKKMAGRTKNIANKAKQRAQKAIDRMKGNKGKPSSPTKSAKCFPAGTLVATPEGQIPIETLEIGEQVIAYDLDSSNLVIQTITETISNFTYYWVDIQIADEIITATRSHLFWVESEGEWIHAIDLKPGMSFLLVDGSEVFVEAVELRELEAPETTFNLVVNSVHNYFVGTFYVLVHNGSEDTDKTRRQALREAKKANDVPKSQQPKKTIKPGTSAGDATGLDDRNVRQYEFENTKGETVEIREDKPAKYKDGGKQGDHFNSGKKGEKLKRHDYFDKGKGC